MLYIFDMENVSGKAFEGVETLDNSDKLIVFYSQNSKNISWDTHLQILECKALKEYLKVKVGGKNALDFQLASFVGYKFGENPKEMITIVSGDTGFDYIVDFWTEKNCSIVRKNAVYVQEQEIKEEKPQNLENTQEEQVSQQENVDKINAKGLPNEKKSNKNQINTVLCKKISSQSAGEIYKLIDKYKTKQGVNNAICKKFGSQQGGEVYKIIKPLIEDKKGK